MYFTYFTSLAFPFVKALVPPSLGAGIGGYPPYGYPGGG